LQPVASVRDQLDVAKVSELLARHFRYWHKCEVPTGSEIVCLSGQTGRDRRTVSMTRLTQTRHQRPTSGRPRSSQRVGRTRVFEASGDAQERLKAGAILCPAV
jgi:hypothetical protein